MLAIPLIAQAKATVDGWEQVIFEWLTVGWTPTDGFDASQRMVFDSALDIARIPTRSYPFSSLWGCLVPLSGYLLFIAFGTILLKCCGGPGKRAKGGAGAKSSRPFVPASLLYALKFAYNFVQIFLCSYMTLEALILAQRNGYHVFPFTPAMCNPFSFASPAISRLIWVYYMSKILDWADTAFIVFGNKPRQFTFLHWYHHASVFFMNWLNVNFCYDSEIYLSVALNAGIHVVMYSYYLISMHLPKEGGYSVWWKKHLTKLQMTQFVVLNAHGILILYNGCTQITPRGSAIYLAYIISLFVLFMNFYCRSYKGGKGKKNRNKNKKRN